MLIVCFQHNISKRSRLCILKGSHWFFPFHLKAGDASLSLCYGRRPQLALVLNVTRSTHSRARLRSFRDTWVDHCPIPGGNPLRPRAWQGRGETLWPPWKLVVKHWKFPGSSVAVQCRQDPGFIGLTCNDLGVGRLLAFPDPLWQAASVLLLCCAITYSSEAVRVSCSVLWVFCLPLMYS